MCLISQIIGLISLENYRPLMVNNLIKPCTESHLSVELNNNQFNLY